jgi:hypothetical protein
VDTLSLVEVVQSLEVLLRQGDSRLTVLDDSRVSDGFGDDNSAVTNVVRGENATGGGLVLVGKLENQLVLEKRASDGTKGREGSHDDVVLLAELHELELGEQRVQLDLVDSRDNLGLLEQLLEVGDGEVGDTDRLGLASLEDSLHLLPGLGLRAGLVNVSRSVLSKRVNGVVTVGVEGNRPVNQEHVDIVETKSLERHVEVLLDSVMVSDPDLGGDKDVLSLHTLLHGSLDTKADGVLVSVVEGGVNVSVATLGESALDSTGNLLGGGLPGSQTDGRDGLAVVHGKVDRSHCDCCVFVNVLISNHNMENSPFIYIIRGKLGSPTSPRC